MHPTLGILAIKAGILSDSVNLIVYLTCEDDWSRLGATVSVLFSQPE